VTENERTAGNPFPTQRTDRRGCLPVRLRPQLLSSPPAGPDVPWSSRGPNRSEAWHRPWFGSLLRSAPPLRRSAALPLQRSLVGSLVRFLWIPGASLLPAPFARAARDRCASGGVNRGATIACGVREAKRFSRGATKKCWALARSSARTRVPTCGACAQICSGVHAHVRGHACSARVRSERKRHACVTLRRALHDALEGVSAGGSRRFTERTRHVRRSGPSPNSIASPTPCPSSARAIGVWWEITCSPRWCSPSPRIQ
jgi:hypothetical protein